MTLFLVDIFVVGIAIIIMGGENITMINFE